MIGDKLIIDDYHRAAAAMIYKQLKEKLKEAKKPLVVTIAGESGCGKSETAVVLAEICTAAGEKALLLQQDDYFIYPPETNHKKRLADISWVGTQEVRLDLIEENIAAIKSGGEVEITKPLTNYNLNSISEEKISIEGVKVVIVEGTYTTLLKNADLKAFIDRDYRQTKLARLKRSRDPLTDFLEKVLAIEHEIISSHKQSAQIIIPAPEKERGENL